MGSFSKFATPSGRLEMKLFVTVVVVTMLGCLSGLSHAQCMASSSCLDDKTGIHYGHGDTRTADTCMDCSCSVSKKLLKTCNSPILGAVTNEIAVKSSYAEAVASNKLIRCTVVSESEAASCCSRLFTPVGVHEDCVANLIKGECRYEVVDRATGEPCEHPFGMVGK